LLPLAVDARKFAPMGVPGDAPCPLGTHLSSRYREHERKMNSRRLPVYAAPNAASQTVEEALRRELLAQAG